MQSIITRYRGPTNSRSARLLAITTGGIRKVFHYDHAKSTGENHKAAAKGLAQHLNWPGEYIGGAYDDKGAEIWVRQWEDKRDNFTLEP